MIVLIVDTYLKLVDFNFDFESWDESRGGEGGEGGSWKVLGRSYRALGYWVATSRAQCMQDQPEQTVREIICQPKGSHVGTRLECFSTFSLKVI